MGKIHIYRIFTQILDTALNDYVAEQRKQGLLPSQDMRSLRKL